MLHFLSVFAYVALVVRSASGTQSYTIAIKNACDYPVVPQFTPGYEQNVTILSQVAPGGSIKYTFPKKDWYGTVTASNVGSTFAGNAEIDLTTGRYDLVVPNTTPIFQHTLTLSVKLKKDAHTPSGTCNTATCDHVGCKDAYFGSTGLMQAADRPNGNTTMPNHICPLDKFHSFVLRSC